MTLVAINTLLDRAVARRGGVGAFNVILLEHVEALIAGAERAGAPVVLQISQNCVRYHGALAPLALAALAAARGSAVPTAVHLDHATDVALVHEAIDLGITSVMFDASELDYEDNVAATRAVVEHCHARGVAVEAELGEVGGKDGVHAPGARTRPGEAAEFVRATGVDSLAVAVGTSHAMRTRDARVDHELIGRLSRAVPVPLVLHGSSGVADAELVKAVDSGMTKVNIATRLNDAFSGALRDRLDERPDLTDPRTYLAPVRDALAEEAHTLLRLLRAG